MFVYRTSSEILSQTKALLDPFQAVGDDPPRPPGFLEAPPVVTPPVPANFANAEDDEEVDGEEDGEDGEDEEEEDGEDDESNDDADMRFALFE